MSTVGKVQRVARMLGCSSLFFKSVAEGNCFIELAGLEKSTCNTKLQLEWVGPDNDRKIEVSIKDAEKHFCDSKKYNINSYGLVTPFEKK